MTNRGHALLEPGQFVRLPARRDWGLGQIQSVVGSRVTVNFENAGKILVNTAAAELIVVDPKSTDVGGAA